MVAQLVVWVGEVEVAEIEPPVLLLVQVAA
jgi:hypothetical protein